MSKYIFRTKAEKNFTVLKNSCIRDSRLSWEARGVLHFFLSMPEDWEVDLDELAERSPNAKKHVLGRIMKELETCGYIYRQKMQDKNGYWKWPTLVFDTPQEKDMDEQRQEEIRREMHDILGEEILERTRQIKEKAKQREQNSDPEALTKAVYGIGQKDPVSDFPEDVKPTLREFARVSQIAPTKARKGDWIKVAREWQEMGVRVEDIAKMYQHAIDRDWDVSRPGSITSAYHPVKRKKTQETQETKYFRVAE